MVYDFADGHEPNLNWQATLTFAEEGKIIAPVLADCLSAWQENLVHRSGPVEQIRDFSSQRNAMDLGESLRRLGYQQWNYLAVSYGTRVALLAAMVFEHDEARLLGRSAIDRQKAAHTLLRDLRLVEDGALHADFRADFACALGQASCRDDVRRRVAEVARMLGGEHLSGTTLAHAKEMLGHNGAKVKP